jgi:hypothetical protein
MANISATVIGQSNDWPEQRHVVLRCENYFRPKHIWSTIYAGRFIPRHVRVRKNLFTKETVTVTRRPPTIRSGTETQLIYNFRVFQTDTQLIKALWYGTP